MPGKKDPNWEPGGGDKTLESTVTISGTPDPDWVVIGADETSSLGYEELGAIVGPHDNYDINLGGGEDVLWIDLSAYDQSEVTVDVVEGNGNKGDTLTYTFGGNSYELTLKNVESVVILTSGDTGDPAPGPTVDFEDTTTGFFEADTALGTGIVGLSASGYYLLATTTAGGGGLEDPTARFEDQDTSGDLEFRISTDSDGTTHEINVQAADDLGVDPEFEFVSAEVEGVDGSDQVLISVAVDIGGLFSSITVLQVDATTAAADGLIEASELVGLSDANGNTVQASDFVGIDQLMIEAGDTVGDDTFWVDNIELA